MAQIHTRWAATVALNTLLDSSRLKTGLEFADYELPFCAVNKDGDSPLIRSNNAQTVDTVSIRFQLFHQSNADGAAIIHQMKIAFDRVAFLLTAPDGVIDMQRTNDFELQEPDGVWRFVIDFEAKVAVVAGR